MFALLGWLIVGVIAGFIAEKLTGSEMGLLANLIIGVIGAILGGVLFRLAGLSGDGGLLYSVLMATTGALVLLFVVGLVRKRA